MKKRISIALVIALLLCTVIGYAYTDNTSAEVDDLSETDSSSALLAQSDASIDEVASKNIEIMENQYDTKMSAAYAGRNVSDESVSKLSGNLTVSQVDYSIPLTQGSFEIRRIFNSDLAGADYRYNSGPNKIGEVESFYTQAYRLGEGWRFSFPMLEVTRGNFSGEADKDVGYNIKNIMYHSESGEVYSITPVMTNYTPGQSSTTEVPTTTFTVRNHPLKDIEIKYDYDGDEDEESDANSESKTEKTELKNIIITHKKQGIVYTFSTEGKIKKIEYNHADIVRFEYEDLGNDIKAIDKITVDSNGTEKHVEFVYGTTINQNYNTVTDLKFYVKGEEDSADVVTYTYDAYDESEDYYGHRVLTQVIDVDGKPKYKFNMQSVAVARSTIEPIQTVTMNVMEDIFYCKENRISHYDYDIIADGLTDWEYAKVKSHQDYEVVGNTTANSTESVFNYVCAKIGTKTTYTYPTGDAVYNDGYYKYTEEFGHKGSFWKEEYDTGNEQGTFDFKDNYMHSWLRMHSEILSENIYTDVTIDATITLKSAAITGGHTSGGIIFAVNNFGTGNNNFNGYYARLRPTSELTILDEAEQYELALLKMTADGDGHYHKGAEVVATASFNEKGLGACELETAYDIKVKMVGNTIEIYFEDFNEPIIEYTETEDCSIYCEGGQVGLRSYQRRMNVTRFVVTRNGYTQTAVITEEGDNYVVETTQVYDEENNLVSEDVMHRTPDNYTRIASKTEYEYDENRMPRMIRLSESEGEAVSVKEEWYYYDDCGNLTEYKGPLAQFVYNQSEVSVTEDGTDKILQGECVKYEYDDKWFLQTKKILVKDSQTLSETIYVLDEELDNARVSSETVKENGQTVKYTTYEYDSLKRVEKKTVAQNESDDGFVTTYSYEKDKETGDLRIKESLGSVEKVTEKNQLNGNVTVQSIGDKETTYAYDGAERLIAITYADGSSISYSYTESYVGKDGEFDYSPITITITDENKNKTETTYDAYGKPIAVRYGVAVNSNASPIQYEWHTHETRLYDDRGNLTEVSDAESNVITYEYDVKNRVVSQTATGFVTEYNYSYEEIDGQVLYVITTSYKNTAEADPIGIEKVYYDLEGKEVLREDGEGNKSKYEYDYADNKVSETDGNGNKTQYAYDVLNRVTRVTYANSNTESYTYTALDAVETKTVGGFTTTYTYDNAGRLTREEVDGYYTAYTYDERSNVLSIEKGTCDGDDDKSKRTDYEYDVRNRVTNIYTLRNKETNSKNKTTLEYDDVGNNVKEILYTDTECKEENAYVTERTFDYAGRVLSEKINRGGEVLSSVQYEYDKVGNVVVKRAFVNEEETIPETYEYDGRNLLSKKTAANLLETTYEYDARGALVKESYEKDGEKITKTYAYDLAGRMIWEADGEGNKTQYVYDGANNVINKIDARYEDGNNSVKYTYDKRNRLAGTQMVTNGETTVLESFLYDSRNNVTKKQQGNIYTVFTYDGLNNVKTQTKPIGTDEDGNVVVSKELFVYDGSGRLVQHTDGNNSGKGDDAKRTEYVYEANGTLQKVIYPDDVTVEYRDTDFDITGSYKVTQRDRMDEATVTEYNVWGLPEKVTYADNFSEIYTYDMLGRKVSYTNREGTLVKYNYDVMGNLTSEAVYSGDDIVTQKTYTYSIDNLLTSETDGEGNKTEYVYDNAGNVTEIKYANGTRDTFNYSNGFLTQKVKDGVTTVYTYDVAGRLKSESITCDEGERTTVYNRDAAGNVTAKTSPKENAIYTYNGAGWLIREEISRGMNESDITEYLYDANGNVLERTVYTEPEMVTEYTYDLMNNLLSEKTGSVVTGYEVDLIGRTVKKSIGDAEESYSYDVMSNILTHTDALGNVTQFTYDLMGRTLSQTDSVGSVSYTYDVLGNMVSETDGNKNTTTYVYDKANRLTQVINADDVAVITRTYDGKGNVLTEKDANNNAEKYTYANNRLVEKIDRMNVVIERYEYNGFGDIAKVKTAGFEVIEEVTEDAYETQTMLETVYEYDNRGNLTKVIMADGSKVCYTYDLRGNVLTQTDGNDKVTTYEYYPFGKVKSKTDAEGNCEGYVYDVFGNLKEKTDANGTVISYEYDERNNLTKVTDNDTINIEYGYDNNNNRTAMTDATGNYAYTYNARDQVTGVKFGEADYITYTYDSVGNVVRYSNLFLNETIGYEYDTLNRVVKMGNEEYVYDNNGNIVEINNGAGLWVKYTYDKNNRVTELMNQPLNLFSVTDTTYPTFTYEYEYYANGYEKSKTDFNGTVNYTYDNAGRISQVTDSKTGATRQYTYDLNGNRTGLSETFADDNTGNATFMGSDVSYTNKVTNYTYSNTNELVSAQENYSVTGGNVEKITHYEYDKVGNEVSSRVNYATSGEIAFNVIDNADVGVIDYSVEYTINEYDALNRLVYVTNVKNSNKDEATYTYNGDGLRFSSTVKGISNNYQNETRFYHYNGDKLMNITRNALNSSAGKISYIPSLTGYTGFVENGETLVYTKNAHGDVNATINATGNVVDLYTYDEFGNVDYLQKTTDNRILYAGEYLDTETGNYYLKARYYNPYTGRFTQRDPHWTPSNMIYGDATESTPAPDIRSSDYAVYVPTPIQRKAMVLPTDKNKDDKVQSIIAETMAFSQSATYNGNLYDSYFASFGNTEDGLFVAIIARQADNCAILQSTNLYVYCTNNPVMYVDLSGLDAIIITSKGAAGTFGHTSAIYQDENDEWFYTYWGDKASAVIHIPKEYMDSMESFTEYLTDFLEDENLKHITHKYHKATYVEGDFTKSLSKAYEDVYEAKNAKKSDGVVVSRFSDGTRVYQGKNGAYKLLSRNCLDKTYESLSKGTLSNGENVGDYMKRKGFEGGLIPNLAMRKFGEIFGNYNFSN